MARHNKKARRNRCNTTGHWGSSPGFWNYMNSIIPNRRRTRAIEQAVLMDRVDMDEVPWPTSPSYHRGDYFW